MSVNEAWKPYYQDFHKKVLLEMLQFINTQTDALIARDNMSLELHYGSARFSENLELDTTDENLDIQPILERYCRLQYNFLKLRSTSRTKKMICYRMGYELSRQISRKIDELTPSEEVYFRAGFEIVIHIVKPDIKMTTEVINGCRTYDIPMLVRMLDNRCKSIPNLLALYDLYFLCHKLKLAGRVEELSWLVGRLRLFHDHIWKVDDMIRHNLDPYIDCESLRNSIVLIPYEFADIPDACRLHSPSDVKYLDYAKA